MRRRHTYQNWSTALPPAKRSSSPRRASQKPSWFRFSRPEKSAAVDKICWESLISPKISMLLCRRRYRSTLSSSVRLLLDAFLWWDQQLRRLSRPLRAAIADEANDIFVSAATIWEIAIKRATGKLRFDRPIVAAVRALGFEILPVTGSHAEHAGGLPRHHNDPFDRLIVAQAYQEAMVLGTQDRQMRPYGVTTL